MLEILQYVTSGLWVFIGSTIFVCCGIISIGWAINAAFIGIKGKSAE
jgi:hypothetical protein